MSTTLLLGFSSGTSCILAKIRNLMAHNRCVLVGCVPVWKGFGSWVVK